MLCLAVSTLVTACSRGAPEAKPEADGGKNAAPAQAASLTITTTTVESASIVRTVPATGSIFPWQEVIVGAEVGGYRVAAVLVDVGSRVQKGEPLVKLAEDLLQADVASRQAALRSADASETNADAALRRGELVATSGALSAADVDRLKAEQVAAHARVETARVDLHTAELRLRYSTVVAPDSGTVTSRTVSVGQIAQAGQEMLRLLRQDRVEWRAEVPESQLSRIKAGQTVQVTAVDGSTLKGKVRAVAPTVQTNNRTGIAYVDITGGGARPGMFARGAIEAGSGPALLVPVTSVVMQDGYSYVFLLKGGNTVERRLVQQAGMHGDSMEVASGVAAGDVIAVKGAGFLKDGDTVLVSKDAAATP
ncbi:MAG: efflux RND transporter periplasmic adaptor subunit [Pseudomonadota bacterium]